MRLTYLAGTAAVLSLTGFALMPATATAQPGGVSSACSIDPNSPKELAMQTLAFSRAGNAQNPEDRLKILMGVIKELDTKPQRFQKNPAGYNYVLSQALVLLATQPGLPEAPTRGTLGFVTNKDESYDIIVHLDSTYQAIVAAAPECAEEVAGLRQNEAWLELTKAAIDASNTGQLDSAEHLVRRSMIISSDSPYGYYVLGNVANTRGNKNAAIENWKKVVQSAGSDTAYSDLVNGSRYYVAMTQYEMASAQSGEQQIATAKEAAASLKALYDAQPDSPEAPNVMQAWLDMLTMAKDTANLSQVYADLIANPDHGTDMTLTMGGVIATRLNKTDDALRLFEGAVKKNPTGRDALRNLAATYHAKDQFDRMFDPIHKLVALDPNNYDGWMMYAYAAQGLGRAATDPAVAKAWSDSLVKYQKIAEALPVRVDVTGFTRTADNASLTLSLEQIADAGNYTVTAEFLDKDGNVVTSGTESSGALSKGERKAVTVKVTGANIQSYRYKELK